MTTRDELLALAETLVKKRKAVCDLGTMNRHTDLEKQIAADAQYIVLKSECDIAQREYNKALATYKPE